MRQQLAEIGHPIESFPDKFVHGTWVRRHLIERVLTSEELERIPEKHRPAADELVKRHMTKNSAYPEFRSLSIEDKVKWLFDR